MKVRNLIEQLQAFEKLDGNFDVYVMFRRSDDEYFIFDIEGTSLNATDEPQDSHCLMISDMDDVVQGDFL